MDPATNGAPEGKYLFGMAKVGARGQIVIPKQARELFNIRPGDNLLLLGDIAQGIAIVRPDLAAEVLRKIMQGGEEAPHDSHSDNSAAEVL